MSRKLRYGFLSAIVVTAMIVTALAFTSRQGIAQQPPPPNDNPKPLDGECCHSMGAGGRTLLGPTTTVLEPNTGEIGYLFLSTRPADVCLTMVQKNSTDSTWVEVKIRIGRTWTYPVTVIPGRPIPGCWEGVTLVEAHCKSTLPEPCRLSWRVDLAPEGPGITVRRP